MASGSNSRGLVLLLITSCFLISGILFDYMPMIIDDHIKRTIELATNEEILSYWRRPPVDVNSYYWLYEVTNPDQFHGAGEKAQVRQLGPFHFVSRIEKNIVGLSANKFRLTYNSSRLMSLNETQSRAQLDRPVTLPNLFYASILEGVRQSAKQLDGQTRAIAYGTINRLTERYNESILQRNVTARQALLGRVMPIVNKLAKLAQTMGMDGKMPDLSPNGMYGFVSIQNATPSGPFEIYTGYHETARSLGELISYKNKRRLNYYEGKCNRMQTSAGELRPMPIEPEKRLEMFQPMFCRIVHWQPTGQQKLREGAAVTYTLDSDDFASAINNPDNRCFCMNSTGPASPTDNDRLDDNHCSLDGVIDLGPCSYGAPILLAPSSMQLDSRIINSLGSDFDPELLHGEVNEMDLADDKSQLVVLKRVGVPIRVDVTVTLFLRVVRDPAFKDTANVPDVSYLPMVTVRETVVIPPKLAQIIVNLESFISLTYHIKVVMYLTAVVLLFWLSGHYYCLTSDGEIAGLPPPPAPPSDQRRPSRVSESALTVSSQMRRPTISAAVGPNGAGAGNGSAGGGGGGPNGANGLQRAIDGEPVGNQTAGKRMSFGQTKSSPVSEGVEIRHDDKFSGSALAGRRVSHPRGSLLQGGPRALCTVDETIGSQEARPPGDTTSSDRANSADSNKSLPPSRHTSRLSSLSQTSANELEAASAAAQSGGSNRLQQKQQQRRSVADETSACVTNEVTNEQPIVSDSARQLKRSASLRVSLKVGEQAARAPQSEQIADLANGTAARPAATGKQTSRDEGNASDQIENTTNPTSGQSPMDERGAPPVGHPRRKRKNWFMNVYSNFVQMLNGLRSTINESGKIDMNDNDYGDKQLEMLAGKIDNWYTGHDDGNSAADGAPTTAEAESGANEAAGNAGKDARVAQSTVSPAGGALGKSNPKPDAPGSGKIQDGSANARTDAELNARTQADTSDTSQTDAADKSRSMSNRMNANEAASDAPSPMYTVDESIQGAALAGAQVEADSSERLLDGAADVDGNGGEGGRSGTDDVAATAAGSDPVARPPSSAPTAKQSELDSTERNGLNSRSMRVESSHAIDDDDKGGGGGGGGGSGGSRGNGGGDGGDVVTGEGLAGSMERPSNTDSAATQIGSPVNERPEGEPGEGQAPAKCGDGGRHSSEIAADGSSASSKFKLASTSADETETEPETEAEANELDKATTLNRIEAALSGSDEEMMANQLEAARAARAGDGELGGSGQSGVASAVGDNELRTPMINSSASLDSVIDLKALAAEGLNGAPMDAPSEGLKLVNQSTTANGEQQLASKTSSGQPPAADKLLRPANGLPVVAATPTTNPTTTTTTTRTITTTPLTNERQQQLNEIGLGLGPGATITERLPDADGEKLVEVDDDETDQKPRQWQRTLQEEPATMRAENSSKSLVSNSLFQQAGRLLEHSEDGDSANGDPNAGSARFQIKNASSINASALAPDEFKGDASLNDKTAFVQAADYGQTSRGTEASEEPTANGDGQRRAADDIQSANLLTTANDSINGSQTIIGNPLSELAKGQGASDTQRAPSQGHLSDVNNMVNSGKQRQRQQQQHIGQGHGMAHNGSITSRKQLKQSQYDSAMDDITLIDHRQKHQGQNGLATGNNLHETDVSGGSNISNDRMILHYQSQMGADPMRRLMADQRSSLSGVQAKHHRQTTSGHHSRSHHNHHHQRTVQPAGA